MPTQTKGSLPVLFTQVVIKCQPPQGRDTFAANLEADPGRDSGTHLERRTCCRPQLSDQWRSYSVRRLPIPISRVGNNQRLGGRMMDRTWLYIHLHSFRTLIPT